MSVMTDSQPLHLPRIVHPSTRLDKDPKSINITARAVSRASSLGDLADRYYSTNNPVRPYEASESAFKKSKIKNDSSFDSYEINIPENVKTVYSSDPNKISIPVFEQKNSNTLKTKGSRPGSSASSISSYRPSQTVDIDEYYLLIKEKVKSNFHEIKTKFRNADPDGKGGVSKEAFAHILAAILGPTKPLSHQHFLKLVEKMGLKKASLIRYEEFVSCIKENRSDSIDWLDTARSSVSSTTPVTRKATQVFVILKEKSKMRTPDMIRIIPQLNGSNPGRVFKMELLNGINGMGIKMEQDEFEKLWKKFDQEGSNYVKSEVMLKKFGINAEDLKSDSVTNLNDLFQEHESNSIPHANLTDLPVNNYKVKTSNKSKKNPIEKWLKKKFRNGFSKIKQSFEEIDLQKTGEVRRDQFMNVLRQNGFQIENNLLDEFLERCGIKVAKNSILISYVDFLEKFQNRSERGLAYKFITSGDMDDDKSVTTITKVERNLLKLFQNDFLTLLQIFRKIDRNKTNTISKQEFRAAIESHFSIELTDSDFEAFLKEVPKDSHDRIRYLDFMTKFDTDSSSSLFDARSIDGDDFKPKISKKKDYDPIIEENEEIESPRFIKNYTGRSAKELNKIIKDLIKERYKDVENVWNEIDTSNSNEISKDTMYTLFKKLKVEPQITRDEVDFLWNQFILKDNKKLEYWQFVRHFGYSKKSAAFLNAKIAPPKHGDNDMMLTSNKLGRDSILIRGSVQSKLILQHDILKRSFKEIDPYGTKYLLRDEFEEILRELCPELNNREMDFIYTKYANGDGRINYMDFLAPYRSKKSHEPPADNLKKTEDLPSSRLDINDPFLIKLRMKLSENYKELRRVFKKHDQNQSGFVSVSGFKDTLKLLKVNLNDDDMYVLMRKLDKDVTGMINYNKFINEYIKP